MQEGQRAGLKEKRNLRFIIIDGCLYHVAHIYRSHYLHIITRREQKYLAKQDLILGDEKAECQQKRA